mmetsp:Transcript_49500/g.91081  ORF Transcript_49500/g.91081 Transcript_49500/m.91081 type:complete len:270 (+) Transcript_49500:628-1437(+)
MRDALARCRRPSRSFCGDKFARAASNFPVALASSRMAFAWMRTCSADDGAGPINSASTVSNFPVWLALMRMSLACIRTDSTSPEPCNNCERTSSSFPVALAFVRVSFACWRRFPRSAFGPDPFISARTESSLPVLLASISVAFAFCRNLSTSPAFEGFSLIALRALSNLPSAWASIRIFLACSRESAPGAGAGAASAAGAGAGAAAAAGAGGSGAFSASRFTWPAFLVRVLEMNAAGSSGFSRSTASIACCKRTSRLCCSRYCFAVCIF